MADALRELEENAVLSIRQSIKKLMPDEAHTLLRPRTLVNQVTSLDLSLHAHCHCFYFSL